MSKTLPAKLFDIQQRIKPLVKDSNNPFFKSKYADLNQCLDLVKGECKTERLLLVQGPDVKDGFKGVRTAVIDVDTGQSVDCFVPYSGNEKNAQEVGAATTYNRRFGIVSLFALEQDDDDGESAVGRGSQPQDPRTNSKVSASPQKVVGPVGVGGVSGQPEKAVPTGATRKTVNEKISLTSKVLIDSKRATQEDVVKMLTAYGVKDKNELNDEQARKLLIQLEEKLNK